MTNFENVSPSDIVFESLIHTSNYAQVYLVQVRGRQCIMKVQQGRGPREYYEHPTRELDIHVREANAYARLHECGITGRGITPKYLGSLRKFNVSLYLPNPSFFRDDEYPPSAIFLEYIPGLKQFTVEEYTPEREKSFLSAMDAIHKSLVTHNDIRSRNIMIVEGEPERIVVLDFDRAETYNWAKITDREKGEINTEDEIVKEVVKALKNDHRSGELSWSSNWFYGSLDD